MMKKVILFIVVIVVVMVCVFLCWSLKAAEEITPLNMGEDILKTEQGQVQEQEDALPADSVDAVKRPDEAVLYNNQKFRPYDELSEYKKRRFNELPPPSFRPLEDAHNAMDLGLLTPTIYSRKITLPLNKGGTLVLGRDQALPASTIYLDPHVVNEKDPEGTQYGFYFADCLYMSYNRPNPELPTSQVYTLDDFRSLEIYDLSGEPLAQFDERAGRFAIFPESEYERIPSSNYFINGWTHEFIPCDGGVSFGSCYFHYKGESELLPSDMLTDEYCQPFMAFMVIVRLSDGEILDVVTTELEETEFNVFELRAVSLGADFKW